MIQARLGAATVESLTAEFLPDPADFLPDIADLVCDPNAAPANISNKFKHYCTGGCKGKNELGKKAWSFDKCQKKCKDNDRCVSFEYRKHCEWRLGSKCCQMSDS